MNVANADAGGTRGSTSSAERLGGMIYAVQHLACCVHPHARGMRTQGRWGAAVLPGCALQPRRALCILALSWRVTLCDCRARNARLIYFLLCIHNVRNMDQLPTSETFAQCTCSKFYFKYHIAMRAKSDRRQSEHSGVLPQPSRLPARRLTIYSGRRLFLHAHAVRVHAELIPRLASA